MDRWADRINFKWVGLGLGALAIVIILVAILVNLLRTNSYGEEIAIDNFDTYFSGVPQERKDLVFANLYESVFSNNGGNAEAIPTSGAMVREGTAEYTFENGTWQGNFIVDIAEVRQSYRGYFQWTENESRSLGGGYAALFTCLPATDLIYGDFGCKDMFSEEITSVFPITNELPLMVEYYANSFTTYVKYEIKYEVVGNNESLKLLVTDYTGGNLERAKEKIKELGYNPSEYGFEYSDVSSKYQSTYAGD